VGEGLHGDELGFTATAFAGTHGVGNFTDAAGIARGLEPHAGKVAQVLADSGTGRAARLGERAHIRLAVGQLPQQGEAGPVGKQGEDRRCHLQALAILVLLRTVRTDRCMRALICTEAGRPVSATPRPPDPEGCEPVSDQDHARQPHTAAHRDHDDHGGHGHSWPRAWPVTRVAIAPGLIVSTRFG
jgi:hypothetical protein